MSVSSSVKNLPAFLRYSEICFSHGFHLERLVRQQSEQGISISNSVRIAIRVMVIVVRIHVIPLLKYRCQPWD